jgi:diguanylate cyclase (GGDEF)-like protein/PAS domain S-box-containing protein
MALALSLVLALAAPASEAARRDYRFDILDGRDGLSQNTVEAMLQDRDGFLWLATQAGLHRYDGRDLRALLPDPESPGALPDDLTTALAEDADGELWVGTAAHYALRLDRGTGGFQRYLDGELQRTGDRAKSVRAMAAGAPGVLWIATRAGVDRFETRTGRRRSVLRFDGPGGSDAEAHGIALGDGGQVWVASDLGLWRIGDDGDTHVRLPSTGPLRAVHRASDGEVYAAGRGVFRIDREALGAERIWPRGGGAAPSVTRIGESPDGALWLATEGAGLVRLDPGTGHAITVRGDPGVPDALPADEINSLLVDRSGLLWVGTASRGAAYTRSAGARFPLVLLPALDGRGPGLRSVRSFHEDAGGQLWVGTDAGGLLRYSPEGDAFDDYSAVLLAAAGADGVALPRVSGITSGGDGVLWVSGTNGLMRLDPVAREARALPVDADRLDALPERHLRGLLRDRDGSLWIGTNGSGVVHYEPAADRYTRYPHVASNPATLSAGLVTALHQDRRGRIWVGTIEGLNIIEPASGRVTRLLHRPGDPSTLSGNIVRALHEGADGRLWVGSHGGLDLVQEEADGDIRFQRVLADAPQVARTVYGIREDGDARLWLSGNGGLHRYDPADGALRRFDLSDGLQDLEFNGGADLRLRDGRLAFGGLRGFNLFDPAGQRESDYAPSIHLVSALAGAGGRDLVGLAGAESLAMDREDGVLRLRFAALDFTSPENQRYQYRLDGVDGGWVDAWGQPEATYTNLAAGRYTFQVRATNADGRWAEEMLSVPLEVIPPWWAGTPARLALLLLVAAVGWRVWLRARRQREQERRLHREIAQREERLKLSLWGSGDSFWDWDIPNNRLYRTGADQLVGAERNQTVSTDDWRHQAVHPDDLPRVQRLLQEHITGLTEVFESEHRLRTASDDWIWVRSRGKVVERDALGNPLRMAGTARDISASRRAERERRVATEVLRSMSEAVAVVDLDFRFVSVNPAFSRITGYSEEEVVGQSSRLLDSTQHSPDFYRRARDVLERTGHWAGEMWQKRKDGDEFLGWLEISEVRDGHGRTHFVTVVNDITDKKRAEQELRYLANYDTLTGLPNRALLSERLARAIVRARRQDTKVAVLFLDLDRFKDINDSLGHAAGDRILKATASRLLATVGASDTVARLSGDEFTVVLEDIADVAAAERVARDVLAAFTQALEIDERHDVIISPSVGVALYPDHGLVPTDLLKFADTAMYQAKSLGRNTYQVYTEAMDAEARRRATVSAALRKALDRGEFRLVFQPRLSLMDGRITGVEALLRWNSQELGEISPAVFIPLAEESGLILPIGEWVLREACATLKRWRHHGLQDVAMAVNVSVLQLLRGDLPSVLRSVLEETGVPAKRVELEVTESMVMQNAEQTTAVLHELQRLGVTLAIDDFGTGYSSLVYLKRLPIDTLKIDKEFVGDLTRDPDDEAITATVITMAHSLGLNVIAEGVETAQQLAYLREQGCDEIQGYWLSAPLDAHRCLAFIRTWQPSQVAMLPSPY